MASFRIRIRGIWHLLFGLFETCSDNLVFPAHVIASSSTFTPNHPGAKQTNSAYSFIYTSTASPLLLFFFLPPPEPHWSSFPAPPPWNIFYYSLKGALSTSPFSLRGRKTRHLWLFNADFCHLLEQNLWIIKIKHNHKLQNIDSLASSRGLRRKEREGRQGKLFLDAAGCMN